MGQKPRSHLLARATGLAILMGAVLAPSAAAHPHVWVTVESTVLYERGTITGIRHQWTFDQFYTAMAVQGLDTNNDGNYDRQELAELAQVNMDGLKEFAYFTQVRLGNQSLAFEAPKDFYLEYDDIAATGASQPAPGTEQNSRRLGGRAGNGLSGSASEPAKSKALRLHFTLPLKQPVLADAPGFTFTVSDPTYYIAFELAKTSPVKVGAGAPAGCRVTIGGSTQERDDAERLSQSFSNQVGAQGFSFGLAKPISVVCAPKS